MHRFLFFFVCANDFVISHAHTHNTHTHTQAAQAEAAKRQFAEHGGELGGHDASALLDVTAAVVGDSDVAALGGLEQVFAVGDSMLE